MQYDYVLKEDIYGNFFIEFLSENNVHGYNYYGKDFLNSLLSALEELKPSLENEDNNRAFSIIHGDEEIREKFENIFNPDSEDDFERLVIMTVHGKIILEGTIKSRIIITGDNNSELIKRTDEYLRNDITFNKG